jgi:hypothetical protein
MQLFQQRVTQHNKSASKQTEQMQLDNKTTATVTV